MTTDQDLAAAYEAFRPWRERPVRSRIGTEELAELEQSVADAIAAARQEGRSAALQPVRELIAEWEAPGDARHAAYRIAKSTAARVLRERLP